MAILVLGVLSEFLRKLKVICTLLFYPIYATIGLSKTAGVLCYTGIATQADAPEQENKTGQKYLEKLGCLCLDTMEELYV